MTSKAYLICLVMVLADASLSMDPQIDVDRKKIGSKVLSRRKRFVIFPTGASVSVAVCTTIGVYGNPQFSIFSWALNYGFAYNLPSNSSYFLNPPKHVFDLPFFDPDDGESQEESSTTTTTTAETLPPDHDDHDHSAPSATGPSDSSGEMMGTRRQYPIYYQSKYESKPMIQRRYRREIYQNIEAVIDKMGYPGRDCLLRAMCESPQVFSMKQKTMVQELIKTVFSLPKSKVLPFEHPELLIYDEAHRKGRSKIDCQRRYDKCGFSLIKMALGKYSQPL